MSIHTEARRAFAKRDRLETELRAVNIEIAKLKAQYMVETRTWGIRDESFRNDITKVAA
jgi:hypothetical protein